MKEIMKQEVNRVFKCDVNHHSRLRTHVYGRIALSNWLRFNTKMTLMAIGEELKKGHDTIIHYLKEHDNLYKYDSDYRLKYDQLKQNSNTTRWLCNWCEYPLNFKSQ